MPLEMLFLPAEEEVQEELGVMAVMVQQVQIISEVPAVLEVLEERPVVQLEAQFRQVD